MFRVIFVHYPTEEELLRAQLRPVEIPARGEQVQVSKDGQAYVVTSVRRRYTRASGQIVVTVFVRKAVGRERNGSQFA